MIDFNETSAVHAVSDFAEYGTDNRNEVRRGSEPDNSEAARTPRESGEATSPKSLDPFDPMNLGISADYAAAISAQASAKPVELRKPNDQEFFRTSPHPHQRVLVGGIQDKQDMSKLYVVPNSLFDEVWARFPKHVRTYLLVLTQSLVGAANLWGVPQSEDRGSWNSTQREACEKGQSQWTNMTSGRGKYDITTVNNPKEVDWNSFPPINEILRQALSGDGRLIDSLDHPLLCKLRGQTE